MVSLDVINWSLESWASQAHVPLELLAEKSRKNKMLSDSNIL